MTCAPNACEMCLCSDPQERTQTRTPVGHRSISVFWRCVSWRKKNEIRPNMVSVCSHGTLFKALHMLNQQTCPTCQVSSYPRPLLLFNPRASCLQIRPWNCRIVANGLGSAMCMLLPKPLLTITSSESQARELALRRRIHPLSDGAPNPNAHPLFFGASLKDR